MRNVDQPAFLLSAARNLAVAGQMGLDMMVLCKCGFGTLKAAQYMLARDEASRREVDRRLREQGLKYDARVSVRHFLSVLYHDVGLDALKERISHPLKGLNVAAHVGCHALRPSHITEFDDPVAPRIFDELVKVTGAKSLDWDTRLDCCGAPLLGVNDELSLDLTRAKLQRALEAGADTLATACPYCQLQFETALSRKAAGDGDFPAVPPELYAVLLAAAMGIETRVTLPGAGEGAEKVVAAASA